jgi:hypothetical protein
MNKKWCSAVFGIIMILILTACQAQTAQPAAGGTGAGGSGNGGGGNFQNNPAFQTRVASNPALQTRIASGQGFGGGTPGQGGFGGGRRTPTATLMPTIADTPTPVPSPTSQTAPAEQAVQDYFAALQKGDYSGAAQLVSAFSRMQAQITTGDLATQLSKQGGTWSDLKILDSQVFNDNTTLVHVQYQLTGAAQPSGAPAVQPSPSAAPAGTPVAAAPIQRDEIWPVRLEAGKWLYNWKNVIDFSTLTTPAQTIYGLTLEPLKVTRYSDHLTLTLLAQNGTAEAIVIGQPNQILATFHFGSQAVDSVNTRYIIDAYRSYTNIDLTVPGMFKAYPDSIDIVKFKNYSTQKPWFTFTLGS